ncbi:MAG: hypothetical protein HY796_07020 [Elusimicrobia bacterium]|nr:hypothetical protein [Elusimicrobiota bacterium]
MRYWLYSEGNILGPYSPAELMAVPAFAQSSLVCPETAAGDSPGDWRSADQVAEIAEALSVGVGGVVSSGTGGWGGAYELETGLSSSVSAYYEAKNEQPYGYETLLNTIDNILGAYKETGAPAQPKDAEPDSSLMDRFDIRLSKIQEELEAARWEKNLLLERIRSRDREDQKNKERIMELEEKLKNAADKTELQDKEIAQFVHLAELKDKSDTIKKIEEIKQESLAEQRKAAQSRAEDKKRLQEIRPEAMQEIRPEAMQEIKPKARQEIKPEARQEIKPEIMQARQAPVQETKQEIKKAPESKPLKSIRPSHAVGLKRTLDPDSAGERDERNVTSRKLTSLGPSRLQSFGPEDFKAEEAPGGEAPGRPYSASAPLDPLQPLPQQASGIVYDFTVVTRAASESEKVQFKIGAKAESAPAPVSQPALPSPSDAPAAQTADGQHGGFSPKPGGVQPPAAQAAARQPQDAPAPAPAPASAFQQTMRTGEGLSAAYLQTQPAWLGGQSAPGQRPARTAAVVTQPSALSPKPQAQETPADAEKNVPLPDKTERIPVPLQKKAEEAKKPQPAAKKSRSKIAFLVTLVVFGSIAAGGLGYFFFGEGGLSEFSMLNFSGGKKSEKTSSSTQAGPKDEQAAQPQPDASGVSTARPAPGAAAVPGAPKPAVESASNENTRKALETVKKYKLSGGRGAVSSWFANSFLSNSARGLNEEWSATVLHGDIFVVQYRLLKPKQDPLIYQFEVDVAKAIIVRGINNNAIELLDFSSKATAKANTARPRPAPKSRPKTLAQLPLPDEPQRKQAVQEEPSGFETPAPEENEKVKYIRAQESDEDLF